MIPSKLAYADQFDQTLELIGPIIRLQVQIASLKFGERPASWYDPGPIRAVPALRIDDGGVTGLDGGDVPDVHHRDHPQSKFRGENGVSIGFTGHYAAIRGRYDHLADGMAGENILVEAPGLQDAASFADGVAIDTASGQVVLSAVVPAPPCVEFSKYCNRYPHDRRADATITETVRFLGDGLRGFYAVLGSPVEAAVSVGDQVYRIRRAGSR